MTDQREKLLARKEQLEREINEAKGWGAALSVKYEELQGVNRALEGLPEAPAKKKKGKSDEDGPSTSEAVRDLGTSPAPNTF